MCDMNAVETHLKTLTQAADAGSGLSVLTQAPQTLTPAADPVSALAIGGALLIVPMVILACWSRHRPARASHTAALIGNHAILE